MKKFFKMLCVLLCVAIGASAISACTDKNEPQVPEHTHTYETEWTKTETEHYKKATCEHTDEKGERGVHVWGTGDKQNSCTVCGYVKQASHVHAYTAYGHDTIRHWKYCPADNNVDPDSYEAHAESGTCVCGYVVPKKSVVNYTFTGKEKDRAGYAEGTVEIIPANGVKTNTLYELYWGDDEGAFKDYYALGSAKGSGASLQISVGENIAIPRGATKLYATENGKALASYGIPAEKQYQKAPQLVFASVSDVHVNYVEGADFWTNALNEYKKAGVQYIIISGDLTVDGNQFPLYKSATERSNYTGLIFSSIGNHEQQAAGRAGNFQYAIYDGNGKVWVQLDKAADYFADEYQGKLNVSVNWFDAEGGSDTYYYYALIENNLYAFMDQMLSSTGNSSNQDNFSATQLDWLENVLNRYSGTHAVGQDFDFEKYNLNIVEHALIKNYSAGDKYNGGYSQPIVIKDTYANVKRFVSLLEKYNEAIWMSGHTHLGFTTSVDFVDRVYANDGTLTDTPTARSVHNSSVAQARWYQGSSIIYKESYESGSEGYICYQFADDIVYAGLSFKEYTPGNTNWQSCMQNKVFSQANFIMPVMTNSHDTVHNHMRGRTETKEPTASESGYVRTYCALCGKLMDERVLTVGKPQALSSLQGEGTQNDAIKISSAADWTTFVNWIKSSDPVAANMQSEKSYAQPGYGLYFEQTADITITEASAVFTGSNCYAFAGSYNGKGYKLSVNVAVSDRACVFPVISGRLFNLSFEGELKIKDVQATASLLAGIAKGGIFENCLTTLGIYVYGTPTPSYICAVCGDNAIMRNIWVGGSINTRSGNAQDGYMIQTRGTNAQVSSVYCKLTNGRCTSVTGITYVNSRKDEATPGLENYRLANVESFAKDWLPIKYENSEIVLAKSER